MVDWNSPLPVKWQCQLLKLPRSSLYYTGQDAPEDDLALMQLIDQCHLRHLYYGSRRIRGWLQDHHDWTVNRKRVRRLMPQMGLTALYPKRNLSSHHQAYKVYPHQLRNLAINRVNHVWAADVTYIPMAGGFVYLVAIIDWYSRVCCARTISALARTARDVGSTMCF
jgi:putative transposase